MSARALAVILGIALAVSVGVNLFAAAAAFTVLTGQDRIEALAGRGERPGGRPSARELVAALDPEARPRVRQAMRDAALKARPEFQAARQARRQAVAAAAAAPFDRAAVLALLDQSRAAEARGRASLEADTVAIMDSLEPADRAAFARILNGRGRGDRRVEAPGEPDAP